MKQNWALAGLCGLWSVESVLHFFVNPHGMMTTVSVLKRLLTVNEAKGQSKMDIIILSGCVSKNTTD
jgi:hypothetical protein